MLKNNPIMNRVSICLISIFLFANTVFAKATYQSRYQPGSQEVRITLYDRLPQYTIQNDQTWSRIVLDGAELPVTQTPDHPQLPSLEYWISVPEGTVLKQVIVKAHPETTTLAHPLVPVQKLYINKPGVVPPELSEEASIYQGYDVYPKAEYEHEMIRMGSTQVLVLKVHVFKYIGAEKKMVVYLEPKIQLTLQVPHWSSRTQPKNIVDREIKRKIVNPEEAFFNAPLR